MRRTTALWITVGLVVALAPSLGARAGTGAVADQAEKAAQLMFASDPSEARLTEGLLLLLGAVGELAPEASTPAGFASKVADARRRIRDVALTDLEAAKQLHECYRAIHGGGSFEMPASVRSAPDAAAYGRHRLESVRRQLDRGKPDEALRDMLEAVLAILTPMERRCDM